jgi:Tol biopolymer transport system component
MLRWFTWVVIGVVVAAGVIVGVDAFRSSDQPASTRPSGTTAAENPASTLQSPPPFADIHGWIAYGDDRGIWAVDPTRPEGDRPQPIRLSDEPGKPVAWSRDGSKLLIIRRAQVGGTLEGSVSILNADGVETRVLQTNGDAASFVFASRSPDGLQIVYSTFASGIHLANADGGDARLLKPRHVQYYASDKTLYRTLLFAETFSPDGSQIAYVDGIGDWGNSIRVMDADGGHVREIVDSGQKEAMDGHVFNLAWSPDGSRLAFDTRDGIWVVGLDGSGLRMVIRHGGTPTWSPDGSRLAYVTLGEYDELGPLRIADADGSHVQTFAHPYWQPDSGRLFVGLGAWSPVEPASS